MNVTIKKTKYIYYLMLAILLVVYSEYISRMAGPEPKLVAFSILFLSLLAVIYHKLFRFYLLCIILIPLFPRDILFVYDAVSRGDEIFNSYQSVFLGPVTLPMVNLVIFGFFAVASFIMRGGLHLDKKMLVIITMCFAYFAIISMISGFSSVYEHDLKKLVASTKPYFIIFFAVLTFLFFNGKKKLNSENFLFDILAVASIIIAIRIPVLLVSDFLDSRVTAFNFLTYPELSLLTIFYFSESDEKNRRLPVITFLGLLFVQRAQLLLMMTFAFSYALINRKYVAKFFLVILLVCCFFVLLVGSYFPALYNFVIWKFLTAFEFFTNPTSGSSGVRVLEIINIMYINSSNVINLLFGSGPFALYDFDFSPFSSDMIIDSKSFSSDQLIANQYYTTHSFIAFVTLRYGLLGLLIHIILCWVPFIAVSRRRNKRTRYINYMMGLLVMYYSYSNFLFQLILGFYWALALRKYDEKGNFDSNRIQRN